MHQHLTDPNQNPIVSESWSNEKATRPRDARQVFCCAKSEGLAPNGGANQAEHAQEIVAGLLLHRLGLIITFMDQDPPSVVRESPLDDGDDFREAAEEIEFLAAVREAGACDEADVTGADD